MGKRVHVDSYFCDSQALCLGTIPISIPYSIQCTKIYDIIDLNQGISPREKKQTQKFIHFQEIFSGYLID